MYADYFGVSSLKDTAIKAIAEAIVNSEGKYRIIGNNPPGRRKNKQQKLDNEKIRPTRKFKEAVKLLMGNNAIFSDLQLRGFLMAILCSGYWWIFEKDDELRAIFEADPRLQEETRAATDEEDEEEDEGDVDEEEDDELEGSFGLTAEDFVWIEEIHRYRISKW